MSTKNKRYLALMGQGFELDLSFSKSNRTKHFATTIRGDQGKPFTIDKAFIAGLSKEVAELMPDDLSIDIKGLLLGYSKDKTGNKLLAGAAMEAAIDLSRLPLIGGKIPEAQKIAVRHFQLLLSSKDRQGEELKSMNASLPPKIIKLPVQMKKGANVGGLIQVGEDLYPINIGTSRQSNGQDTSGTHQPIAAANKDQTTDVADLQPGITFWKKLNKKLGPVMFKRIGIRFYDYDLYVLADTDMKAGPLTFSMIGLGAKTPIQKFQPTFHLDGLGVDYYKNKTRISGALLRDSSDGSFLGTLIVSTQKLSIAALGAYQNLDGQASFFVYGVLTLPVAVGPSFLQVEGMSVGFGYNRYLRMPGLHNIRQFPLVQSAMNGQQPGNSALDILNNIRHFIPARSGEMFFAFGLKFSSFKMIKSFALLTLRLGQKPRVDLVGMARMAIPNGAKNPIVQIEVALQAFYDFAESRLQVQGGLTPASYIFSRQCMLTGGFAFASWFSGPHAGDFIYTIGGYHPSFRVPAHYPKVPRVGFHWQLMPQLSIKGGMYFALVPGAVMAGGSLSAVFKMWFSVGFDIGIFGATLSGMVHAYFLANANFLISWKPFFYTGNIGLSIGIGVEFRGRAWFKVWFIKISVGVSLRFNLSLGASLRIWGPPFSGVARVNWSVVSFDIAFGRKSLAVPALNWTEFRDSFLPGSKDICNLSIAGGLLKNVDDFTKVIDPTTFELSLDTAIPLRTANSKMNGSTYGISPMHLKEVKNSDLKLTIIDTDDGDKDVTKDFLIEPIYKNAPEALWGKEGKANLKSKGLMPDLLMGVSVKPLPKKQPKETEKKPIGDFAYDVEGRPQSWSWSQAIDSQPSVTDEFDKILSETKDQRMEIINALGLDASYLDWSRTEKDTSSAFLKAPQVVTIV